MESSEAPKKISNIEISNTADSANIIFHGLLLNEQNQTSPEVDILVEKQPIKLIEGQSYNNSYVLIDKETEKMQKMAESAKALLEIPEIERPRKVLEILRKEVRYAYDNVIEELAKVNPNFAKWITSNTGVNAHVSNVLLSELIEKGYGVCKHLPVAYLWLAQKAGLQGILLNSNHGTIKNILRTDNNENLFKSAELNQPVLAHSWVEIKTTDGKWIPVDPSVNLVGDTDKGLTMFKEANYLTYVNEGLDFQTSPDELWEKGTPILFAPGESQSSGKFCLELKSAQPIFRIGSEPLVPTNIPYSGKGKLDIKTTERAGKFKLNILKVTS